MLSNKVKDLFKIVNHLLIVFPLSSAALHFPHCVVSTMGGKRMLTAYIELLELYQKDTQDAIREVIAMMEQLDKELAKADSEEQVEISNTFKNEPELTITTRVKPELMVMSKITPALCIAINCTKKKLESAVSWLVQVVCAEHQVYSHTLRLHLVRPFIFIVLCPCHLVRK